MTDYNINDTDQTVDIFIPDSSSTTGAGLTGLAFNSSGLSCYYRKGATGTATALSLVTQTVGAAHTDGGFVEIDATNMPGWYRLDLPDTLFDTEGQSSVCIQGATNAAPVSLRLIIKDLGIVRGKCSGTPTTASANTDLSGFSNDQLNGRHIVFLTGNSAGEAREISDYASTSGVITFASTLVSAPAANDKFAVV